MANDNLPDDEDDHDIEEVDVEIFDLALAKTMAAGSPDEFFPGETVTFVVTVFNQGTVPAANVIVEDYVPAGLRLMDSTLRRSLYRELFQWVDQ